jgi:hypothetical protein
MTIEKCADYPAVEHAGKSLVMRLGTPFGNELLARGEASYSQALFILRPAAEAYPIRRMDLLYRSVFVHIL